MRRRLYFLLPDLSSARGVVEGLLLARIEARHIHVLGKRDVDLEDLPTATVFQKTDVVHGAQLGALIGAALGASTGALLVAFPPGTVTFQLVTILVLALVGTVFGIWVASLAGAAVPNTRLRRFEACFEHGQILVMVDVPFDRQNHIAETVMLHSPTANFAGIEPSIPAFP
jgi:hypothetical protein